MFNLLVMAGGWPLHQSSFSVSRILEYTEDSIRVLLRQPHGLDYTQLRNYPALFMPEQNTGDNLARVGRITNITGRTGGDVTIEYSYDPHILPISVDWLATRSVELQMHDWEFSRTHWAVKDVDLYEILIRAMNPNLNQATVFSLGDRSTIDPRQLSAMMPFHPSFSAVYEAIRRAGERVGMNVNRADDIWEHTHIIQDIASLISRSRIIIGDCTGKNPNVFYEIGIAHAIGREVILLAQHQDDVPFDLRHLRYIHYLNNGEGLQRLEQALYERVNTLLNN
ncbi:hypothetical protein [Breoghania sp.]|uniref:hypothetical protein n=1 Tax=Breoghania sp. TaxID=2065378 RepID=UPI002AAAE382|nr:hypothetical protein [Breoghania sp.]